MITLKPLLLFLVLCPLLRASNPNFGTIPQPANLVGDSLDGCIPLTSSICYHNYGYGIHRKISSPKPFLNGAKTWKQGSESNQNLASVFGIFVKPTDGTNVPYLPVEIHIKDWPAPKYSPHSKSEVLAATIHCLLQSCSATPEHPLDIRIVTENPDDKKWAEVFAKKYITSPGKDQQKVSPTPVGKSLIKTDSFGVRYVIFPNKNPKHLLPKIAPIFLPIHYEQNWDSENSGSFIPTWPTTSSPQKATEPLLFLARPNPHFYELFNADRRPFSAEFHPLLQNQQSFIYGANSKTEIATIYLQIGKQSPHQLAMMISAAVLTTRAQHHKALRVSVAALSEDSKIIAQLTPLPGWEKDTVNGQMQISATFDYDPKTKTLSKGTLPNKKTIKVSPNGHIHLIAEEK